jgi:isopentenyl phosphate kinase
MEELVFLKLGGSLITEKDQAHTVRKATLQRLAREIASACRDNPNLRLVLGHGSGSFGHMAARKHNTRQGVASPQQWAGFAEVWNEARALNQLVVEACCEAGLPVIAFPPSANLIASRGQVVRWDICALQTALSHNLVPLVNGDTIFDEQLGGTIFSTEELFQYLAHKLHPARILLAGIEQGVWTDFPACTHLEPFIDSQIYQRLSGQVGGASAPDVTGGMAQKVELMLSLASEIPGLQALIFSGEQPGLVYQALSGAAPGTLIKN